MNFLDQEILSLKRNGLMEMANQVLVFGWFETCPYVNFIGPLIPRMAEESFALIFEVIKAKFEHMVKDAT